MKLVHSICINLVKSFAIVHFYYVKTKEFNFKFKFNLTLSNIFKINCLQLSKK